MTTRRDQSIEQLNSLLPQTQCELCEYPGCKPYATAIIDENAPIDRCLPGGVPVMQALGEALARPTAHLIDSMTERSKAPTRAVIREAHCIGCTKCLPVCPTDAIIGTGKKMHTVLVDACTGCELCLPVCPVDCIDLVDRAPILPAESNNWRARHEQKHTRETQLAKENEANYQTKLIQGTDSIKDRQAAIQAAIARTQQKKTS